MPSKPERVKSPKTKMYINMDFYAPNPNSTMPKKPLTTSVYQTNNMMRRYKSRGLYQINGGEIIESSDNLLRPASPIAK